MQETDKFTIDRDDDEVVPCPVMPTNEDRKVILVGEKHHNMLHYLCGAAVPRATLKAQAEALIEAAYRIQRGKEKKAREARQRA